MKKVNQKKFLEMMLEIEEEKDLMYRNFLIDIFLYVEKNVLV